MSKLFISPYINFQGKAQEAMEFYQNALGGELVLLTSVPGGNPKPAEPGDNIMHAYLESDGVAIMGSDGSPAYPPTTGDNIAIALSGEDMERLSKIFSQIAEGGIIKQELKEESWGTFGWMQDKFGINWMFNITPSK